MYGQYACFIMHFGVAELQHHFLFTQASLEQVSAISIVTGLSLKGYGFICPRINLLLSEEYLACDLKLLL
jgi:hypothetical protein